MIQLLFTILFAEVALVFLFMVKTPLRKLVIAGLDRAKRGRGPVIVKTLSGTVFVILVSSIHSIFKIQNRSMEFGTITPTDQVLMGKHLLEATLMGYSLLLSLIIDQLHHYVRELRELRKKSVKQNGVHGDGKTLEEEIAGLRVRVKQLESESQERGREAMTAEANAVALRKQSEGFLLEYDRLLEDNQNLRTQLQLIERRLSRSDSRKIL